MIANHPFGIVDGLALCYLASLVRSHFGILIHSALCREPLLAPHFLPVDFGETPEAVRINIDTKRRALATLRAGNAVAIFPSGAISIAHRIFAPITDEEWKLFLAKLVQASDATVVPIFFPGQNSRLYHIASHINDTLRTSLIVREVYKRSHQPLRFVIGDPLSAESLHHIKGRRALIDHLRTVTYALAD